MNRFDLRFGGRLTGSCWGLGLGSKKNGGIEDALDSWLELLGICSAICWKETRREEEVLERRVRFWPNLRCLWRQPRGVVVTSKLG